MAAADKRARRVSYEEPAAEEEDGPRLRRKLHADSPGLIATPGTRPTSDLECVSCSIAAIPLRASCCRLLWVVSHAGD
jgi:hypothetical protein